MIRNLLLSTLVITVVGYGAWRMGPELMAGGHADAQPPHAEEPMAEEAPKGPHGGKLFAEGSFALELVLFESGVPPEFHVYAYRDGEPLPPDSVELTVELSRLGGRVDRIGFTPLKGFLRGDTVVIEPHSFDVTITARNQGKDYQWSFASYEGRTEIPDELAREAGIATEAAIPATITEALELTGRVAVDPARVAQVNARFPGVVQSLSRGLGERVAKGEVLAEVQSNESLRTYPVKAPIDGLILRRDLQVGGATGDAPLFVIADLSRLWVELDLFGRDLARVAPGQPVVVATIDGARVEGAIDFVSPLAQHASQSVQARVVVENADGRLRPGQFVRGRVTVAEHPVALAVRPSAIQKFRDFQVVFAKFGERYEVRMLELGRRDAGWVEVLGGLETGTEYVTENSYLIKADVEKSGASHDH